MHACLNVIGSVVPPPAYKHEDMNPTEFYQNIYLNYDPGNNTKEINIYVRHKPRLQKWKYSIMWLSTINSHAAPGLKLKISKEKLTSDIIIRPVDGSFYTKGSILADSSDKTKPCIRIPLGKYCSARIPPMPLDFSMSISGVMEGNI